MDLTARTADEEQALVRSLDAQLARPEPANCRCRTENVAAEQLAALPGDDAVRAKVQWLLTDGDDHQDIRQVISGGLAASRNYDLQLQLLEGAWRDPQHTPDNMIQRAIENTRKFQAGKPLEGWRMIAHPESPDAIASRLAIQQHNDVQAIVDSLPQRTGRNLTDTAYFLIDAAAGIDAAQLAAARPIAIAEFEHMDSMQQGLLLETAWKRIRDPLLVPALRSMLDQPPAEFVGYGQPLERLIELDPASARPYVLREICDPHSTVHMQQMAALPDAALPETDACLLQQITANALINKPSGVAPWPEKALIAGRFASAAIYPQMLALYSANPMWNDAIRGAVIAYLVRWHPEIEAQMLPPSERAKSLYRMYTFSEVQKAWPAANP